MRFKSLNASILFRLALVTVAILACCVFLYMYQHKIISNRIEQEAHDQLLHALQQRIEKKMDIGLTNAISIASNSRLPQLIAEGDREGLRAEFDRLGATFNRESNFKGVKILLSNPDHSTLLKSWDPETRGDRSEPAERLLSKVGEGQAISAFVADEDGLLLHGVAPVRQDDQIVGYVQFLQGVGSVSRDFEAEGLDYLLLVNDAAMNEAPRLRKNKRIGEHRLANDSWFDGKVVAALDGLDLQAFQQSAWLRANGRFAVSEPLRDVTGKVTGLHILALPDAVVQQKIDEVMRGVQLLIGLFAAGVVALALVVFLSVRRSVLRPLFSIAAFADEVASGDWDARPQGTFRHELLQLKDNLLAMVGRLRLLNDEARAKGDEAGAKAREAEEAYRETKRNEERIAGLMATLNKAAGNAKGISSQVLGAVAQLADEVDEVKEGMTTQQDRLTETATAMEEMNATVLEVARNAGDAAGNASASMDKAYTGASGVRRSVETISSVKDRVLGLRDSMSSLGDQADGIGDVLQVISDIADQTNLLALNAAIEAARAGEAGRGFAVVADEVRKLAEKTMTATKEVAGAIHSIQDVARRNIEAVESTADDIMKSTTIAEEAVGFMEEIVAIVQQTTAQVESIATAAEEQSATSDEINRAVTQITSVATETASRMSRSADFLAQVNSLIGELDAIIQSMASSRDGREVHTGEGPLIKWPGKLALGVPEIDEQHRRLVDYINELHDAMRNKRSQQVMTSILEHLGEYVVEHFSREEELFGASAYPDVERHKEMHRNFVDKVMAFDNDLKRGRATVQMEVLDFLKNWLVGHIMGTDKQYAPYLLGKKRT